MMSCVMSLTQYCVMLFKKLFCGIHRLMISICNVVSQFNDSAKGSYYLLINKELDQLKHSIS